VHGTIRDAQYNPVDNVMVLSPQINNTAISAEDGKYQIIVPANIEVQLHFRHMAYHDTIVVIKGSSRERLRLDLVLTTTGSKLEGVDISTTFNDGYTRVDPRLSFTLPSPTGGAEGLIKMLPGVSSVNELSSQYNVRGGNYDENLIFVNDIQIYRPFLVRNGNQEGLSFVNLDLTHAVKFSAGGFPAKYGDKMSSVMDVEYKKPKQFGGSFMIGFLGASAHIEGSARNKQKTRDIFTYLVGVRYKNNGYLLNAMETKGDYKPNFFDTQMLLGWNISDKFEIELLGNFSINTYLFVPSSRITRKSLGLDQIIQFRVYFDGQEVDKYENYLGGLTFKYRPNLKNQLRLILSSYYAKESETFDIQSQYWLSDVEINWEDRDVKEVSVRAVGTNHDHARNHIQFLVSAADFRGDHQLPKRNNLSWGVKVQNERINDRLHQWNRNDSAGYTLPHIPTIPGDSVPFDDPSRPLEFGKFNYLNASNSLNTLRITGFVQDTWKIDSDIDPRFTLNGGVRFHYWSYNNEFHASPRVALLYKPRWKHDWLFWLKTGVYYQTPFYREYRNRQGELNPNIKSQFSYQAILASEYNFKILNRPFKLSMEGYYKYLDNLISYFVDNIQIVYSGVNDSKGFATGFDARFSGELIEGLESWLSISIMNTMDKYKNPFINNQGELEEPTYKRRPTDQRFAMNLFFQDHIPGIRQLRVSLNFVYSTGIPYWNPVFVRTRENTLEMNDYFRVDIGFSYIFFEQSRDRFKNKNKFARAIKNAGVYFEVFNLLGNNNVSSYMWIKDITNQLWPIPNYLTPRLFNLKFAIEF
jgi:hypothetical protein